MMRKSLLFLPALLLVCVPIALAAKGDKKAAAEGSDNKAEVVDPAVAAQDPDFLVQGEYLGDLVMPDGARQKLGVQVVALGDGNFDVYLLAGGLPGDGWTKGDKRVKVAAKRDGQLTTIEGDAASGKIEAGAMTLQCKETGGKAALKRVERKSPTLDAKPPQDAKVLFEVGGPDEFQNPHLSDDGNLFSEEVTKDKFGGYRLHLEFRLSWKPFARGQARSNSGVYIDDCYEIQVLDSFGLEGADNECGGLYKIKAPDVNMCLPPLVWQTYDVEFMPPEFDSSGKKTKDARLTVKQNGVVIQDDLQLPHATPGRQQEGPGPRPLYLQGHGNHVEYRNIWLVPNKG